jgi:hypothetical protein
LWFLRGQELQLGGARRRPGTRFSPEAGHWSGRHPSEAARRRRRARRTRAVFRATAEARSAEGSGRPVSGAPECGAVIERPAAMWGVLRCSYVRSLTATWRSPARSSRHTGVCMRPAPRRARRVRRGGPGVQARDAGARPRCRLPGRRGSRRRGRKRRAVRAREPLPRARSTRSRGLPSGNWHRSSLPSLSGVRARTVAVRAVSSRSAISPKASPELSVRISRPSPFTSASPSSIT